MPELPDVEAAVRLLNTALSGDSVIRTRLASVAALKTVDPPLQSLEGREIIGVSRRGKHPIVTMAGPVHLVMHLSRGGWLHMSTSVSSRALIQRGPLALRLELNSGRSLDVTEHGRDHRLALHVVSDVEAVDSVARLGPDALAAASDAALFQARLMSTPRAHLKTVLTDQSVVSGIGNAFSDEILHSSRLSPFRAAGSLTPDEFEQLRRATESVLTDSVAALTVIELRGLKEAKLRLLRIHNHAAEPCPVCTETLRRVDLGSRSIEYCPRCQTGGRILADRRLSRLLR